tara:strand:- start:8623 stop:9783 length:1161 start_codon:yes stop_codon:yes gene_type:complete
MFNKNIKIENFYPKRKFSVQKKISKLFKTLINSNNEVLSSMKKEYVNKYNSKLVVKFKKFSFFNIIGMGGSVLGSKAIYNFLGPFKKEFKFFDNFSNSFNYRLKKSKSVNIIVSKSGNTLETISNLNFIEQKNNRNIFITEDKKSYLFDLSKKLNVDLIHHNKLIGGRYSVLSEIGMFPSELLGLSSKKFKRLNYLIKNKKFEKSLIKNISDILIMLKNNKRNSIILNYDDKSHDLFKWYQQLVAESLGKKNKGILPLISSMPMDNHSLMQYYLEGTKNCFFTLFFVKETKSNKINNNKLLSTHSFLKNKSLNDISYAQFRATEKVFKDKKIPFRSFVINGRNEKILGDLFIFFILETILLGKVLKVDPFDQPAVELIKKNTLNFL